MTPPLRIRPGRRGAILLAGVIATQGGAMAQATRAATPVIGMSAPAVLHLGVQTPAMPLTELETGAELNRPAVATAFCLVSARRHDLQLRFSSDGMDASHDFQTARADDRTRFPYSLQIRSPGQRGTISGRNPVHRLAARAPAEHWAQCGPGNIGLILYLPAAVERVDGSTAYFDILTMTASPL